MPHAVAAVAEPSSETELLVGGDDGAGELYGKPHVPPSPQRRRHGVAAALAEPAEWVAMLCRELNATFVLSVALVYGLSNGVAGSLYRVVSDYYWKDVQKVQPATVQLFSVFLYLPWVLKPVWGVLTDAFPVAGFHRRPYFVFAGILGATSAIILSTVVGLPVSAALLCFIGISTGVALSDVTIDACIAKNSIEKPSLAPDMQSLSMFSASFGALIGFLTSGVFVSALGAQGALLVMAVPAVVMVYVGFVIYEIRSYQQAQTEKVLEKVGVAINGMSRTIKMPVVWKPTLYMFLSFALSISTHEGQFYWYTNSDPGNPGFSQEFIGIVYAAGAIAAMLGVLTYHKLLKDYPFRSLLFYVQLVSSLSGMLDLMFVLRWNLKLGIPDYIFIIMEECVSRMLSRMRWMPMMVLSTKLCPLGVEGTFFAFLMCLDSLGMLTAKTGGAVVLRVLNVTRTDFHNLWLAVLVRNLLRLSALGLIFLVPTADQTEVLVPPDLLKPSIDTNESLQLVKLSDVSDDL